MFEEIRWKNGLMRIMRHLKIEKNHFKLICYNSNNFWKDKAKKWVATRIFNLRFLHGLETSLKYKYEVVKLNKKNCVLQYLKDFCFILKFRPKKCVTCRCECYTHLNHLLPEVLRKFPKLVSKSNEFVRENTWA